MTRSHRGVLTRPAWTIILCLASVPAAAQQPRRSGVGSRAVQPGPTGTARVGAPAVTTGPQLAAALDQLVPLVGNDTPCFDGTIDCRRYRVAQTSADPNIAYAGGAILTPLTLMTVWMATEGQTDTRDPDLCGVELSVRVLRWVDVVEQGRTVAKLTSVADKVFAEAQRPGALSTRYRLVWCSMETPSRFVGKSWRLRIAPKSAGPAAPPDTQGR